jgi:Na+/melibiose symporter-like transporter
VPFTAMTPELANSYDEATELTTFRQFICILWGIVATFAHSMIISSFPSETNPEVNDYKKGNITQSQSLLTPK